MCLAVDQSYEQARKRAWYAVRKAIAHGILTRPDYCSACGVIPGKNEYGRSKIHAHHYLGYAPMNRLDVVFICEDCHHEIHMVEQFRARYENKEV